MGGSSMKRLTRVGRSLLRNLIQAVPTMFVIVTLGFFVLQLAPGDAADYMAAESGAATQETVADIRRAFGLDLPLLDQLANYYTSLAHFSLGISPRYGVPVADLIMERLPGTLTLMVLAIVIALLVGIAAGTIMALNATRAADRILSVASLLFYSVPTFWIGLIFIIVFSVKLGWLPAGGMKTIGASSGGFGWLIDRASYALLPATSLALYYMAIYARLTRSSILEVIGQDHVRTAKAKGLAPRQVVLRHVLRNALIPITTVAGIHVAGILGGAIVIETVFSWPGMGRLAFDAVMAREYTLLLGIMLVSSVLVICVNAIVDIIQAALDPRIEVR
ncbi:ABC transporter permease subunit [Agrobacterium vitis]|uniref:ABC transporter permease n=12 Tax=Rhizobium/Agrobacterium group TaxID=227290 RepID=A0A2Z2PN56_AGRTU|nr:ABC transporter permease [Agrobacterium radiobacter]ASK43850.1 ABC transporter permease [Rhizobium rhizogenes]ASK49099.1 ABC transporter permease [Agrobacterium deltaense]MCF1475031.1 ABC transporter permease [Allorhizobium ampelinum]MCF1501057.1 ABC transporter permease [Allorhizobium sp. Av2]MQB08117.1 ABC transporter permease [Agrobacterium tumefaciens]MUZ60101.1 ABC transporter permease subunit [Agrobacterium vitis]CUX06421.1 putative ABC transporter, permease protein [Agrobacterium f